jgi:hypothetical protein
MIWRAQIAAGLLAAALVATAGVWWHGYRTGKVAERTALELRHNQAMQRARDQQEALADELERAKGQRTIVYRDRVRTVQVAADPSGCGDVPIPDSVRDALTAPGGGTR